MDQSDSDFGRFRIPRSSFDADCLDCSDLPNEDDLLTDVVVPEAARLQRLKEIQLPFQQEGIEPYTSSCRVVAKYFGIPVSLVSLVYEEFQWFKAKFGVTENQTERCWSFCAHTFTPERPEVLYVPDPLLDERFRDNLLVHQHPSIRFYCGVPLVTQDGVRLGALCIIDKRPRTMSKDAFQFLINVTELTVRELLQTDVGQKYKPSATKLSLSAMMSDTGRSFRRIPTAARLRRLREQWFEEGLTEGILMIDISMPQWIVVWTNSQWEAWSKCAKVSGSIYPNIWSVLQLVTGETGPQMQKIITDCVSANGTGSCTFLARVFGLDGESSVLVSCEITTSTHAIKGVNCQIGMPSNVIEDPAIASFDTISFDGSKLVIAFVKLAPESLADDTAEAITEEAVLAGALRPGECLELKRRRQMQAYAADMTF